MVLRREKQCPRKDAADTLKVGVIVFLIGAAVWIAAEVFL
jgi:hypothetical protein